MRKRNLILLTGAIAILIGVTLGYVIGIVAIENKMNLPFLPSTAKYAAASTDNITARVEQYLTQNFLSGYGLTAKVTNVTETSGVLAMNIDIIQNGAVVNNGEVFVTSDGELAFVGNVYNMSASSQQTQLQDTTAAQPPEAQIQKSDKPNVSLYVMSFCPYGNLAENTMLPVYNLLKDKVNWEVHYIVDVSGNTVRSLHGQPEVDQNQREACVLKNYGQDKWWEFSTYVNVNCGSGGACWETAANLSGIDTNVIKGCVTESGLSLMQAEADTANTLGVSGSPTLFVNGVESSAVYQYGNSELYKQTICGAFNSPPSECGVTLESASAQAAGSCG